MTNPIAERAREHVLAPRLRDYAMMFENGGHTDAARLIRKAASELNRYIISKPSGAVVEEWQPIETAPKDGQIIWAWLNDSGIRAVRWSTPDEAAEHEGGSPEEYDGAWVEASDYTSDWSPRWWKPYDDIGAPPPPSPETEGEK